MLKLLSGCPDDVLSTAREEGLEEGRQEGLEEGIERGVIEGKRIEQQFIATNFKKQGIAPEIIAQCTGLSIEEIDKL